MFDTMQELKTQTDNLRKRKDINPSDYASKGMEIIDKNHDAITANQRVKNDSFIAIRNAKEIYFSIGACRRFNLYPGGTVHFINDNDQWLFYIDSDADGFPLLNRPGKNTTIIINASLISLFLKRTRHQAPCKFPLTQTLAEHNGRPIIRIEINKPIE